MQDLGAFSPGCLGSLEIVSGAICEAKMHYAEVVALWYTCIINSICGLLKNVSSLFADMVVLTGHALGHFFITFLLLFKFL